METLSSSAFVSVPIYGPSCFPVIISSVSVSRVSWLCPRCLQLCLPIYSLFCPMLPVDYCKCHVSNLFGCSFLCLRRSSSIKYPVCYILVPGSPVWTVTEIWVPLYNKVSFVNINVLINMNNNGQCIYYTLYYSLLMLVNTNRVVHYLFMLVHNALTNAKKERWMDGWMDG